MVIEVKMGNGVRFQEVEREIGDYLAACMQMTVLFVEA